MTIVEHAISSGNTIPPEPAELAALRSAFLRRRMEAKDAAEQKARQEAQAAALRCIPIRQAQRQAVLDQIDAEGVPADEVLHLFALEYDADERLLDSWAPAFTVALRRDGYAPIQVELRRHWPEGVEPAKADPATATFSPERYKCDPHGYASELGVWMVRRLLVSQSPAKGPYVYEDTDGDCGLSVVQTFAEALHVARWQWERARAELDKAKAQPPKPPPAPKVETGGSAFPSGEDQTAGMELREWFAGLAVMGLLASPHAKFEREGRPVDNAARLFAAEAYRVADEMLAQRKGPGATTGNQPGEVR